MWCASVPQGDSYRFRLMRTRLSGYTPFDRDSAHEEMEAIIAGNYKFEPEQYWEGVSSTARDFVRTCLTIDPTSRPTAAEALTHPWLSSTTPHFVPGSTGGPTDLLPQIRKAFDAKKTCMCSSFLYKIDKWLIASIVILVRKAVLSMMAVKRMSSFSSGTSELAKNLEKFRLSAEAVLRCFFSCSIFAFLTMLPPGTNARRFRSRFPPSSRPGSFPSRFPLCSRKGSRNYPSKGTLKRRPRPLLQYCVALVIFPFLFCVVLCTIPHFCSRLSEAMFFCNYSDRWKIKKHNAQVVDLILTRSLSPSPS